MKQIINSLSAKVRALSDELLAVSKQLEGALNLDAMEGLTDPQKAQLFASMFPKENAATSKALAHLLEQPSGFAKRTVQTLRDEFRDESHKAAGTPSPAVKPTPKPKPKPTPKPKDKGKRTEVTPELILETKELHSAGSNKKTIAAKTGLSYPIVLKILKGFYDSKLPAPKLSDGN